MERYLAEKKEREGTLQLPKFKRTLSCTTWNYIIVLIMEVQQTSLHLIRSNNKHGSNNCSLKTVEIEPIYRVTSTVVKTPNDYK